ncbi:porin family protein [Winogradskyella pelagia]|uniref:porin family protein n=1 Tax=Winogradskyella pelagia TaxID=2819984 RepID=UPI001FBA87CF|nr:porin family protein [Winogradskyella sp. DF17]
MKPLKSVFLMLFLTFCLQGQSQILLSLIFGDKLNSDGLEFGLEGGFNFSDINTLEANRRLASLNLGFYFDFRLKNQWNIYTGVLVKARLGDDRLSENDLAFLGITPKQENGDYTQRISYFVVPVLLKYNFKNRIYLEAGPQFGLMYDAFVEFNADNSSTETRIRDFNKDNINKIDTGLTIGTGYKLRATDGMTIGIKYYHGLTNVYKNVSGTNNNSIFLKLNIPIGANKAKKSKDKSEGVTK